jgi:hypothetical protein
LVQPWLCAIGIFTKIINLPVNKTPQRQVSRMWCTDVRLARGLGAFPLYLAQLKKCKIWILAIERDKQMHAIQLWKNMFY